MDGTASETLALATIYVIAHVIARMMNRLAERRFESDPIDPIVPLPVTFEARWFLHQLVVVTLTATAVAALGEEGGNYVEYLRWWGALFAPLLIFMAVRTLRMYSSLRKNRMMTDPEATPFTEPDDPSFNRLLAAVVVFLLLGTGLFLAGSRGALGEIHLELERYETSNYAISHPAGWDAQLDRGTLYVVPPASFPVDGALLTIASHGELDDATETVLLDMKIEHETAVTIEGARSATRQEGTVTVPLVGERYDMVRLRVVGGSGDYYLVALWGAPGSLDELSEIGDIVLPTFEVR